MGCNRLGVIAIALLAFAAIGNASPDVFSPPPGTSDSNDLLAKFGRSGYSIASTSVVWSYSFDDPENSIDEWTFVDGAYQDPLWYKSAILPYGDEGKSWTCAPTTLREAYIAGCIQGLLTPAMDLSDIEVPMLSFQLRVQSELGCDGGTVMIWYGNSEEDAVRMVLPSSLYFMGPDYNGTVQALTDAFGEETIGWSGYDESATYEHNEWTRCFVDLNDFRMPYVRIGFVFASDANEEIGIGMQVDDIAVDGSQGGFPAAVMASDCDYEPVGGEMEVVTGAALTDAPTFHNTFTFFDDAGDQGFSASSAPTCMGVAEYSTDIPYVHYIESPEIELPKLQFNDRDILLFSFKVKTGFDNGKADPSTQSFYYVPEFRKNYGITGHKWVNANSVDAGPDYACMQRLNDGEWANSLDFYDEGNWYYNITTLSNQTVKMRFRIVSRGVDLANDDNSMGMPIEGFFDHLAWDDLQITLLALEHDVATELRIPFPNTVGYPIDVEALYTNRSPRANETGVSVSCTMDGLKAYLLQGDVLDMPSNETIIRNPLFMPTEPMTGNQWFPFYASTLASPFVVTVDHQLATDELDRNDHHEIPLVIHEPGTYELGYDGRFCTWWKSNDNPVPMAVRIDPNDFEWFDANTDLTLKGLVAGLWFDSTGVMPDPETVTWSIREDGETPVGTEIWNSGAVPVAIDPNQGQAQVFYHYLEEEDYVTLPFEPFWIVVDRTPSDAGLAWQRDDNIDPETCMFWTYGDSDWNPCVIIGISYDTAIRAIVDGNIKPYYTIGIEPPDGSYVDVETDPLIIFSWAGGSPKFEMMTYVLHLEDDDGHEYTYYPTDTVYELNFDEAGLPDGHYTWYVTATTESGLSNTSETCSFSTILDGVDEAGLPKVYALDEAFPNPFNPTTTLRYQVPRTGRVELAVYNLIGQEVARLVDGTIQTGEYSVVFDASTLASGIYFARMEAGEFRAIRKLILMK